MHNNSSAKKETVSTPRGGVGVARRWFWCFFEACSGVEVVRVKEPWPAQEENHRPDDEKLPSWKKDGRGAGTGVHQITDLVQWE